MLWVPLVTCGGPATTARSGAPVLFSLYSRATCWAICVAICAVVPLPGFQSDQPLRGDAVADARHSRRADEARRARQIADSEEAAVDRAPNRSL